MDLFSSIFSLQPSFTFLTVLTPLPNDLGIAVTTNESMTRTECCSWQWQWGFTWDSDAEKIPAKKLVSSEIQPFHMNPIIHFLLTAFSSTFAITPNQWIARAQLLAIRLCSINDSPLKLCTALCPFPPGMSSKHLQATVHRFQVWNSLKTQGLC